MGNRIPSKRIERTGRLEWVPLSRIKVSTVAQRELKPHKVNALVADWDPDRLEPPTVNLRDGWYYAVNGQHRVEAARMVYDDPDTEIQCWVTEGLTEEQEADLFDHLNNTLAVGAFDKFRVRVTAARIREIAINRVVNAQGLVVSRDEVPGAISAVATLGKVYDRSGPDALAMTLRIIRDAYGDPGLQSKVIEGIGHLVARYNGDLDEGETVTKLGRIHGGVNGLLGQAESLHLSTGNAKAQCVAAAAVRIINKGGRNGRKRLPDWFKS